MNLKKPHITDCEKFIESAADDGLDLKDMHKILNMAAVRRALIFCRGNQSQAARLLGVNRLTLRKYLHYVETRWDHLAEGAETEQTADGNSETARTR